jgi:UDP-3-O-[3-hydroxymyristoyl] glucosamine N-acyltransferase
VLRRHDFRVGAALQPETEGVGQVEVEDVFVHPKGMCESDQVGPGSRVWAHAHVMKGARVGRGCNIGEGSFVETGAILGDFCTVKNGVAVWDLVEAASAFPCRWP